MPIENLRPGVLYLADSSKLLANALRLMGHLIIYENENKRSYH
jgi:hypothetical protein